MPYQDASTKLHSTTAFEYTRGVTEIVLGAATIDIPFAATLVLPTLEFFHTTFVVAALTGNVTIPAMAGGRKGMRVTFVFTQDGTGSRTVTWNAQQKAATNGAGTANQVGATSFVFNGTNWVQEGALAFK